MSEFLYAIMVDKNLPNVFQKWPLHITLVPWFEAPLEAAELIGKQVASGLYAFSVQIGGTALFGIRHNVPVCLMEPRERLQELRDALLARMAQQGLSAPHDRHADHYKPHITVRTRDPAILPDTVPVRSFWLVQKGDKDRRYLKQEFCLL